MLGWEVLVTRKASERTTPATADDAIGELVVRWRAEVEGIRWIRGCRSAQTLMQRAGCSARRTR